jgi:large subunit ribosomal protein L21
MYAVFITGGKQYRVSVGDELFIEKIEGISGDLVQFKDVLMISDEAGLKTGNPNLPDASVEGEIVKQGKQKKIIVFRYNAKKGYRNKAGHRQPYTRVRITRITA